MFMDSLTFEVYWNTEVHPFRNLPIMNYDLKHLYNSKVIKALQNTGLSLTADSWKNYGQ